MKQDDFYNEFKTALGQSQSRLAPPIKKVSEDKTIDTEAVQSETVEDKVKGNGHKKEEELQNTTLAVKPDDKTADILKDREDTRRRMEEAEKTKNIPGNGYFFNREKKHKLETAIINELQLHSFTCARIQDIVMKEEWDPKEDSVKGMYVDLMLEGSIAVGGKAREQLLAAIQFKNQEMMQAARGSLFDNGPTG